VFHVPSNFTRTSVRSDSIPNTVGRKRPNYTLGTRTLCRKSWRRSLHVLAARGWWRGGRPKNCPIFLVDHDRTGA